MSGLLDGYGPIDTVVCDMDGVVYLGSEPIPGALEALQALRAAAIDIIFATNNSTRHPDVVRVHLREVVGFDAGANRIVNSGAATAALIAGTVSHAYVVGTDGLRDTLRDGGVPVTTDWAEADAVVAGLDPAVTYQALAHAGLAIENGAVFYATNTDAAYPRPDGLYPGAGALVAAIATTTGVAPIVCGKPFAPMREAVAALAKGTPLIVGDRPDTDLALGKEVGWPTVGVLTGVVKTAAEIPEEHKPDVILNSIADLPALLHLL